MSKELLQDLADRIGCTYISDLRFLPEPDIIKVCMKEFKAEHYPVSDWNQAVQYLTKSRIEFTSGEEAKQYIINGEFSRRLTIKSQDLK